MQVEEILRHSPGIVYSYRINNNAASITYVAGDVNKLLGYGPDFFLNKGDPWTDRIHPDDAVIITETVRKIVTEKPQNIIVLEYRYRGSEGNYHWLHDEQQPVYKDNGDIEVVGTWYDVSEKRKFEDELTAQRERLSLVIEGTNIGLWDWNIQTGETVFNERWAEIIGYSLKELEPISIETWIRHTHPEDLERSNALIERHMAGDLEYYDCECRMKHKSGGWVWVHDRGKVVSWTADGKPLRMAGTHSQITDRKQTEIELKEKEEKLKSILQTALDGYFEVDDTGNIIEINDALCGMNGFSRDELLAMSVTDLEAKETVEDTARHIENIIRKGSDRFITKHRKKGGGVIDVEMSVHFVKSGDSGRFVCFARDLSQKIRADRALRQSREQLETFFKQSLDGFFFMLMDEPILWNEKADKDALIDYAFEHQRVTKINQAMLDQYGAEESDFIGLTPKDFFAHNIRYGRAVWRQLFDSGHIHIGTDERRFDGSTVWIEGDYVCLYDEEGRIRGHFGIQRDITDQKRANERLREEEEKFRQLAENIDEVFWLRTDTKMIYISPGYEKIWGRSTDSLYKNPDSFIETVHREDKELVLQEFRNNFDNFDMEYRIIRPDGEVRWVWARSFVVHYEGDDGTRRAGIAEDITRLKQAEKQLKESSIRDPLTGVYNRRHIIERFEQFLQKKKRLTTDFAVAILDIDFFKKINDQFGHLTGDFVLVEFTKMLTASIRDYDVLGRYGGEEFIILFEDTEKTCASEIIERILDNLRGREFHHGGSKVSFTFSAGVCDSAETDQESLSVDTLIECADDKLYKAKKSGRNRIES